MDTERREIDVRRTCNGWWQVVEPGSRVITSTRDRDLAESTATRLQQAADLLDRHLPLRGQCQLCGVPGEDQTHRVIDAIADRHRAGDDAASIAEDYGVPVEVVAACCEWSRR